MITVFTSTYRQPFKRQARGASRMNTKASKLDEGLCNVWFVGREGPELWKLHVMCSGGAFTTVRRLQVLGTVDPLLTRRVQGISFVHFARVYALGSP